LVLANNSQELFGDYTPNSNPIYIVTPLEGLRKLAGNVTYAPGCNDGNKCSNYSANDIQNAVKDATVIFVCLGTGKCKTIIKQIAMFYILTP
jgi:beta-glucosidase